MSSPRLPTFANPSRLMLGYSQRYIPAAQQRELHAAAMRERPYSQNGIKQRAARLKQWERRRAQ
jgi:hypothetical protein